MARQRMRKSVIGRQTEQGICVVKVFFTIRFDIQLIRLYNLEFYFLFEGSEDVLYYLLYIPRLNTTFFGRNKK